MNRLMARQELERLVYSWHERGLPEAEVHATLSEELNALLCQACCGRREPPLVGDDSV